MQRIRITNVRMAKAPPFPVSNWAPCDFGTCVDCLLTKSPYRAGTWSHAD